MIRRCALDSQTLAMIEELLERLNHNGSAPPRIGGSGVSQNATAVPPSGPGDRVGGQTTDPLHTRVPKADVFESSWDYAEFITDGYRGDDGGTFTPGTRRLLGLDGTESIIGPDDRTPVLEPQTYPWRMIAALDITGPNGGVARGTGFMVGPTTMLTAGHCVYDPRMGGWAQSISVQPGRDGDSRPFGSPQLREMATLVGWLDIADARYDCGFLEFDEPVGRHTGWFSMAVLPHARLSAFPLVNLCGYPADRAGDHQWYSGGRFVHIDPHRLYYDSDTFGGHSGGPVWISMPNEKQAVTAIHAYGVTGSGGPAPGLAPANSGTRIVPGITASTTDPDGLHSPVAKGVGR